MDKIEKKRPGRPRKEDNEKVEYQRIAVYKNDYEKFLSFVKKRKALNPEFKLTDAFTEMVAKYAR